MAVQITVGGITVPLTHPDKVLFPADGITKADLARYYADVADRMLPGLRDRPISMVRYPDGLDGQRFPDVRRAALWARDLLDGDLGLTSFVRTTGGRGLHVHVGLNRQHLTQPPSRTGADLPVCGRPPGVASAGSAGGEAR